MALYAWKIFVPNREPIARVKEIDDPHRTLVVLNLPGMPAPLGITADADGVVPDTGKYRHVNVEDGLEWSVSWAKIIS